MMCLLTETTNEGLNDMTQTFVDAATNAAKTDEKIATYLDMYLRLQKEQPESMIYAMSSLMLMHELVVKGYVEGETPETLAAFVTGKRN